MSKELESSSAIKIVNKLGGTRPLAKKLGIAPSSVQGWKERKKIPDNRLKEILEIAEKENIDIKSLFEEEVAKTNKLSKKKKKVRRKSKNNNKDISNETEETAAVSELPERREGLDRRAGVDRRKGIDPRYKGPERRNGVSRRSGLDRRLQKEIRKKPSLWREKLAFVERSVMTMSVIYMLATVAFIVMMGPEYHAAIKKAKQVEALEKKLESMGMQLSDLKEKQAPIHIAGTINQKIEALDRKTAQIARQFEAAGKLGGMAVQGRIAKLENTVSSLSSLLSKIDGTDGTSDIKSIQELQNVIMNLKGDITKLNEKVANVKEENGEVVEVLKDVSSQDLGAAAMLLALGELREGIKSEKPFAEDLKLISDLIGNNPEMQTKLKQLAPYAEKGVLSPARLQGAFGNMAVDIIKAGLSGNTDAVNSQLKKHIGNLVTITKDGKPVLSESSMVYNVVNKAEAQIKQGDIAGAVSTLKTLEGPAAIEAQKWIKMAKGTLVANQANSSLAKDILRKISSNRKVSIKSLEGFLDRNFLKPLNIEKPKELDLKWNPTKDNGNSMSIKYD